MKKIILFSFLSLCASFVYAQLKVMPDGKVGIGIGNQTPISKFTFGTPGYSNYDISFEGDGSSGTLAVSTFSNSTNSGHEAIVGYREPLSTTVDAAIRGYAMNPTPLNYGKAAGTFGQAGNAKSGYNYGVYGMLLGSNNGAAVFGDVTQAHWGVSIDGKYAGYFNGNVKVTGTINGTVVGSSDIRFKQNIVELGNDERGKAEVLKTVTNLVPISYNYKQVYRDSESESKSDSLGMFDEKSPIFQKKHYGLIAQDVQEIYPDLVYENDNGYLSINYTELIPLLIQSIKELKEEVDQLSVSLRSASTSSDKINDLPRAVLYQNTPNPFSERTVIKFDLPEKTSHAYIYIFNMQGALLKQIPVYKNQSSVTINGSELTAGMYLYSLIVDGKEIDTKRMILTK